ncbi:MAG TPA: hypothetical protein PK016_03885 [Candidatus Atribacteria bacterium]|nr:hypothetical protein [Candidatus Atribacteria bacterium]
MVKIMFNRKKSFILILVVLELMVGSGGRAFSSVREAPVFTLYTLKGEEVEFHPSNFTFLYFLSPDCEDCIYPLLALHQNLKENEKAKDITLLTICPDCSWREVKSLKETLPSEIEIYFGNYLKALWGVWELPSLFLVNSQNKVVEKWEGNLDTEKILARLPQPDNNKKSEKKKATSSCPQELCY